MSAQLGEGADQAADGRAQFQWRSCFGDVIASRFDLVIRDYWEKVALPALTSAEREVEHWANSEEGGACFVHVERANQRGVTAAAMCLSLQSIWERQLRSYLVVCIGNGEPEALLREKIQHAHWKDLKPLFMKVRGVPMTAFQSFPDLDLLAELGNVCRHGDGRSATGLWVSHPELWPECYRKPVEVPGYPPADLSKAPPVSEMNIETITLERFVGAIASFWEMTAYLYHEGLSSKHWTLEQRLIEDRLKLAPAISYFNRSLAA